MHLAFVPDSSSAHGMVPHLLAEHDSHHVGPLSPARITQPGCLQFSSRDGAAAACWTCLAQECQPQCHPHTSHAACACCARLVHPHCCPGCSRFRTPTCPHPGTPCLVEGQTVHLAQYLLWPLVACPYPRCLCPCHPGSLQHPKQALRAGTSS